MKKFFIAMTLICLTGVSMVAQNRVVNNPENKGYFGIRAGGEIICPGDVTADNVGLSAFENGVGAELGGIYNIPVVANFYIEPGIKFYYNTYSLKRDFLEIIQDEYELNSASVRKFGMRIPVMLGYHFDFTEDVKFSLFTGPELEVGFLAKEHVKGPRITMTGTLYGDEGAMNRFDVLWGVGAGITVKHFYFGVSGGIGMLNMFKDSYAKFHENRVTFSIGYNI